MAKEGKYAAFSSMSMTSATAGITGIGTYTAYFRVQDAFDAFANIKGIFISIVSASSGGAASTILLRRAVDPTNVFGVRFFPISAHNLFIDLDYSKYKYNMNASAIGGSTRPVFWPYININGTTFNGDIITNGDISGVSNNNVSLDITGWAGIGPYISTSATVTISSGSVTERYDQMTVTPQVTSVGQTIVIFISPYTSSNGTEYQNANRDAFRFVEKIRFGGGIEVLKTNFILSSTNGAPDTITVRVPVGAKTGPIEFFSMPVNPTSTTDSDRQKDDYFTTCFNVYVV